MKLKKPSLSGMKNCEYLGHFSQDKFIQQGHNDSGKVRYLMDNKSTQGAGGVEAGGEPGGDFSTGKARPQPKSASEYVNQKSDRINWSAQKEVAQNKRATERFEKYQSSGQSSARKEDIPELNAINQMSGDMPKSAQKVASSVNKRINKIATENYKYDQAQRDLPYQRAKNERHALWEKSGKAGVMNAQREDINTLKNAATTAGKAAFIGTSIVGSRGHLGNKKEEELRKKRKK